MFERKILPGFKIKLSCQMIPVAKFVTFKDIKHRLIGIDKRGDFNEYAIYKSVHILKETDISEEFK